MSLLIWIIVGGLAGWIASMIMKTDASMGLGANIVVGMIGSIIGGFLVSFLGSGDGDLTTAFTNFNLTSILVSILGAVVLLGILRLMHR